MTATTPTARVGRRRTCRARHNTQRIGRLLMATGRDATDVPLTPSFGPTALTQFVVVPDEVPPPTSPPPAVAG